MIKICGIKNIETAREINNLNVDAIGLVFANSKRRVSEKTAKDISNILDKRILRVGVFVNENIENVERIVKEVGLNIVQLHGDESYEYCKKLNFPVIKAFSIKDREDIYKSYNYKNIYGYLFDGKCEVYRGGEGKGFNWSFLKNIPSYIKERLILAGGLNKSNVKEAIRNINPFMVDVSSGVEVNGEKDINLIKEFVNIVKKEG